MNETARPLNPRVLRLNVGDITGAGPGYRQQASLDLPALQVSEDLVLAFLRGPFRLSRTREGVLLQGELLAGLRGECGRCLTPTLAELPLQLEELYSYPVASGVEFSIGEDGMLDLAPLLRAEVLIAGASGLLCKADCRGLCPRCGASLNESDCDCELDDVDPRLAALRQLLDEAATTQEPEQES
ncbi:MAG: DUF177 domain-containing protein [Anaerolineaceae bacterium]|nr:DUF177 domain-containing protein [Anaerolineaceae bacterium]